MRSAALRAAVLATIATLAGCKESRSAAAQRTATSDADVAAAPVVAAPVAAAPVAAAPLEPPPAGHDFLAEARALERLALCVAPPTPAPRHCARLARIRDAYRRRWITPARAFFAAVVPAGLPTTVVYPFAGGDLATALTVFPDARQITTLSLEPAGDPRTVHALRGAPLARALDVAAAELGFLYQVNFSNTLNLIRAMRGGKLPTQLVFSLSALELHGFTLRGVRYFRITPAGELVYLDDADLAALPAVTDGSADARNRAFGNVELRFGRPGEADRVHRHVQWNLDDAHLGQDDRVLRLLSRDGEVAAMTKAASYLLGWAEFGRIRGWLIEHAAWMVSDASGIPPRYARPAGLVQETWGTFAGAHMAAGRGADADWRALFAAQPPRRLPIRFGYWDRNHRAHLIVTRRP